MAADKDDRKARRKHNHRGLKVFLTILILLVIVGGVGGFAFYKGYGWPTQEAIASDFFSAASAGQDISGYLADSVSSDAKNEISSIMPTAPRPPYLGSTALWRPPRFS